MLAKAKLGSTVLYVTHDQIEAAAMADRIAIMEAGQIIQIGSAKELYREPHNRFVASFLGAGEHPESRDDQSLFRDCSRHNRCRYGGQGECLYPARAIGISADFPDSDNVVTGRVVDTTFTNGIQRYKVMVHPDFVIDQWSRNLNETYSPTLGEDVFLGWNLKDTLLVAVD